MSFDIYFLPTGVPWHESMEALEAVAEADHILSEDQLRSSSFSYRSVEQSRRRPVWSAMTPKQSDRS
jgi:hypothetical protein